MNQTQTEQLINRYFTLMQKKCVKSQSNQYC